MAEQPNHDTILAGLADAYKPVLDDDEQEAMDHLLAFMNIVTQRWGLRVNTAELAQGVHVCQGFITQHMLNRLAPEHWSSWYDGPSPVCPCNAPVGGKPCTPDNPCSYAEGMPRDRWPS